jgi:hypothetical protein
VQTKTGDSSGNQKSGSLLLNRGCAVAASALGQYEIDDPAAAHMLPRFPAVGQNSSVRATGLLQGVGQDRQEVEATVVVDALGKLGNCPVAGFESLWAFFKAATSKGTASGSCGPRSCSF